MNRLLLGGLALVFAALVLLVKQAAVAQTTDASLKDLPDFQTTVYRIAPYIDAAALLQALGKDKASATLLKLAKDREHDHQVKAHVPGGADHLLVAAAVEHHEARRGHRARHRDWLSAPYDAQHRRDFG